MQSRYVKTTALILSAAMLVPLAACSKEDPNDPNNRRTLRIGMLYGSSDSDNESYYRQQYTEMFELAHPNIDIEFVSAVDYSGSQFSTNEERKKMQQTDPLEKVKGIMTGSNPVDVLLLDTGTMGQLAEENLLKPLDSLIKEDKIDLESFVPIVMDSIRDAGGGQIYGLSPTFSSSVLFYNKTLFNKMGITPPTDGMNWDDVYNLAERFKGGSGKDATFGLALSDWSSGLDFWSIQNIVSPLKLKMYDDKAEKMTVDSPQWEQAWTKPIQLYKDKAIPHQEDFQPEPSSDGNYRYDPYQYRPFFSNRVAMAIGSYSMINDLATYNQNVDKMKGREKIDWGVVTYPQQASAPGFSAGMYISELTSINAAAQNPDDAWEFVKFLNGKERAKFKARSTYELSTLKEFAVPKDGQTFNMDAFFKLKPVPYDAAGSEAKLNRQYPNLSYISELAQQTLQKAINGNVTVKEALTDLQTKGNELLQKIKADPTGDIDMSPYIDNSGNPEAMSSGAAMRVG